MTHGVKYCVVMIPIFKHITEGEAILIKMTKKMLYANNKVELLRTLSEVDVCVPSRRNGRTTEHVEVYAIVHLLSCLIKRERPDFLLTMNQQVVGIEHTEAVSQNASHKAALREDGIGGRLSFITRHKPGERVKKGKDLEKEIEENKAGDGWEGDSVERDWAEAMECFVSDKRGSMQKAGFSLFDENWLLIYDNWRTQLPTVHLEEAAHRLFLGMKEDGIFDKLNRIFVMSGEYFIEFSLADVELHEVNNLWS